MPIRLIHDRSMDPFTERRVSALVELEKQRRSRNDQHTTQAAAAQVATTQVYQIFVKATPQAIWDAIVKPEFTARYFYGARVETTAEVGAPFRYHSPDGSSLWGDEQVLESDPPHRLVVTWRSLFDEETAGEPASRVSWEIEPQADGLCLLTVVHDHLEGSPKTARSVCGPGWMMVLSGLKTLLETGESLT